MSSVKPAVTAGTDPAIKYSGGWTLVRDETSYMGTRMETMQSGETVEFTFTGTAITFYSRRHPGAGSIEIYLDGRFDREADLSHLASVTSAMCPAYHADSLEEGSHTVVIRTKGAGAVACEAFRHGKGLPVIPREIRMPAFPAGSIKLAGRIAKTIDEDIRNGWINNDARIDGHPGKEYYYPFIAKKGSRWGGEYPSHWLSAVSKYGWLSDSDECRKLAEKAVKEILENTGEDGYIGCLPEESRWDCGNSGFYPMWSYGEGFNALLEYQEYTKDDTLLHAVKKVFDLMESHEDTVYVDDTMAISCANSAVALGLALNDTKYIERGRYWIEKYLRGYRSYPDTVEHTLARHCSNSCIPQSAIIDYFMTSFDPAAYYTILNGHSYLMNSRLHVHGGPSVNGVYQLGKEWCENYYPKDPYADTEICSVYYWCYLWFRMLSVSGESHWADIAEYGLYNAIPSQRSEDGKTICYAARPNETGTVDDSKWDTPPHNHTERYMRDMYTACCHSSAIRLLPFLGKYQILGTSDGGISVPFYGSMTANTEVKGAKVSIIQITDYPFDENIRIEISSEPSTEFPVYLRIPAWCRNPSVSVNGNAVSEAVPGTWAVICRKWSAEDVIDLSFPMTVTLDYSNGTAVAALRGPLLYTLAIPYEKQMTDEYGSFKPVAKNSAVWNYCLLLDKDKPEASFKFTKKEAAEGYAWENPPTALTVRAKRLPGWTDGNRSLPKGPYEPEGNEEMIELVPYGFSTLRMTYLPFILE